MAGTLEEVTKIDERSSSRTYVNIEPATIEIEEGSWISGKYRVFVYGMRSDAKITHVQLSIDIGYNDLPLNKEYLVSLDMVSADIYYSGSTYGVGASVIYTADNHRLMFVPGEGSFIHNGTELQLYLPYTLNDDYTYDLYCHYSF